MKSEQKVTEGCKSTVAYNSCHWTTPLYIYICIYIVITLKLLKVVKVETDLVKQNSSILSRNEFF